jgi:hypothetical protein
MDVVEKLGHFLFGRKLRLRVALWVLEQEETFFLTQAAKGIDYSASGVREELDRLEHLGMVRRLEYHGSGKAYYMRSDGPLWRVIEAARDALAGVPPDPEREDVPAPPTGGTGTA